MIKLLYLAFISSSHPQLLRKTEEQLFYFRKYFSDINCSVIGHAKGQIKTKEHCFTYYDLDLIEGGNYDTVSLSVIESFRPDLIYMRYPIARRELLEIVKKHPGKFIFEHQTKELDELKKANSNLYRNELEYGEQCISLCKGIVGVTGEIVEYELNRIRKDIPNHTMANGVNVDLYRLIQRKSHSNLLQMIFVSSFQYWQGFDRFIKGLNNYEEKGKILVHLVGDGSENDYYRQLITKFELQDNFIFHGKLEGKELDEIYNNSDVAIAGLGIHRKSLSEGCSLKIREYCSRGIPFIYAGKDSDLSGKEDFAYQYPNDDKSIDIKYAVGLAHKFRNNPELSVEIRSFAREKLSWEYKIRELSDFIKELLNKKHSKFNKSRDIITSIEGKKKIVSIIANHNNLSFMQEIIKFLEQPFIVNVIDVNNDLEIENALKNSDFIWLEWATDAAVKISHKKTEAKKILRLHSFEAFKDYPIKIKWDNIDDLIFVSQQICNITLQKNPNIAKKTRIHIVENGVDVGKFAMKTGEKGSNIAFVATIRHTKNLPLLFQCFKAIKKADANFRLHIAGDFKTQVSSDVEINELKYYLSYISAKLKVDDSVRYYGNVNNISEWLKDKDYLISTSIREGMPLNIIEAMAMGIKPVIHNFPGAEDVFPGEYIFNDIDECREIILSDDYDSYKYRKFVIDNYTVHQQMQKIRQIFEYSQISTAGEQDELIENRLNRTGWLSKKKLYSDEISNLQFSHVPTDTMISVIVISWKYDDSVRANLQIIKNQISDYAELIFVNNGCHAPEMIALKSYASVYIELLHNKGAYLARNIGALFADSPILLFLDDDAYPSADLIKSHLDLHRKYDIIALRGRILPQTTGTLKPAHYDLGEKTFPMFSDVEGNTSYNATVFYKVGGWDDDLIMGGGGVDLSIRIFKLYPEYHKQIYSPLPLIYHDFVKQPEQQTNKIKTQQESRERLRRKHPDWDSFIASWKNVPAGIVPRNLNMKKLLISVCIPTYNRAVFLKEAVESVLKQDFTDFEIVIADDGSTDTTEETIRSFQSERIKYFKKRNEGRPQTRNFLIEKATGDFILWLDDDDLLASGLLSTYAGILTQNPHIDVIYGNIVAFDSDSKQKLSEFCAKDYTNSREYILQNIINGSGITFGGSIIRKKSLIEIGGFDESFSRAQDNELWARLANRVNFYKLNETIYYYRKHQDNISLQKGVLLDVSYESLAIRRIIQTNSLKVIYPNLDWKSSHSHDEALYNVAKGLFKFSDFYNAGSIIEKVNYLQFELLFLLYIKCHLGLSNFKKAKDLLNQLILTVNKDDYLKLRQLTDQLINIKAKLTEKTIRRNYLKDELEQLIKPLGFKPSLYYYLLAGDSLEKGDHIVAMNCFLKAVITNPYAEYYAEAEQCFSLWNKTAVLENARNRILAKTEFYCKDR
ncbi:MAG: glycosyltransferase [Candidatus Cloacimonetes bacterium]|nr:glycosyltransferase [Candidatus Cloacimonadota bacterium]